MNISPATVLNQITGQPQPAFDDFITALLCFKKDQTDMMNDIKESDPNAFLLPGEDSTYILQQPQYGFNWNGDPRRFYTINGMPVAQLMATKAKGKGKWVNQEGVWLWQLDPVVPVYPDPANGAGLAPRQNNGQTMFGAPIAAPQGSAVDLARQIITLANQIIQNGGQQ